MLLRKMKAGLKRARRKTHYYLPTLYNTNTLATIVTIRDFTDKALDLATRVVMCHLSFTFTGHLALENVGTTFVVSCVWRTNRARTLGT